MDPAEKKEALRLFTYGLYAITCAHEGERNAFTANWLSQISFDPPLVALSVDNTAHSVAIIRASGQFAINVYDASQRDLSATLGRAYVRAPEKLEAVTWGLGETGVPVLLDTLAWVEVVVTTEVPAGDSTLFIGEVRGAKVLRKAEPLTMKATGFRHAG